MKIVFLVFRWICAGLAWALFFFWWEKASTPGWVSPRAVIYSLLTIALVILGAVGYSIFWIRHNQRIARRGKRGFVSFYKSPKFENDALGRPLKLLPQPVNGYDAIIVVRQNGEQKEYSLEPDQQGVTP